MSFREKERDRRFQLDILAVQLKHERLVGLYSVFMAIGSAFLVFSLSVFGAFEVSKIPVPSVLGLMLVGYAFVGGILLILYGLAFIRLGSSEREDIEEIRRKYVDDW